MNCFVEAGMGYGSGPALSGYGFGFQGPPWAGAAMPDGSASRKRRGGNWIFSAPVSVNMICYDVCSTPIFILKERIAQSSMENSLVQAL